MSKKAPELNSQEEWVNFNSDLWMINVPSEKHGEKTSCHQNSGV